MRRARLVPFLAAFIVATLGVPQHATAAPGTRAAEPRIAARIARAGSSVIPVVLPFRANLVGVSFRGDRLARGIEVDARAHTSDGWSDWTHLHIDPNEAADTGAEPRARPRVVTSPLWVGTADRLEVRVETTQRARPIRDLRVHAYNTLGDAVVEPAPLRWARALWRALGARATAPAEADPSMPDIITRAEWGADESLRSEGPGIAESLKMAFVHHTAGSNDYTRAESPAIVRGIYAYHTKGRGYSDIGYNFLVDRYGQLFEGRAGSIFEPVIGGHVGGMNSFTTGVSLMGTFTTARPPSAMLAALERLLAWKLDLHHVPPRGLVAMTAAEGNTRYDPGEVVKLDRISGHRDGGATACPGQQTYDRLPAIRRGVDERGHPKIYLPSVRPPVVRPDGDGVSDAARFTASFSRQVDWTLTIRDPDGVPVRAFRGTGTALDRSWTFMRDGIALGAGRYAWTLTARRTSTGHAATPATGFVDVFGPFPRGCACAGADFDGDGFDDLAIGVPRADVGDVDDAGSVNVLYGSATGLTADGDDLWHAAVDGVGGAAVEGDGFGNALATGDFDGDGFGDLAVGVPGADLAGVVDAGAVNVLYGSADGLTAAGDDRWREGVNGVPGSQQARDRFGASLAAGDFDGDGRDDLAVGIPGQNVPGARDAGALVTFDGSDTGLVPAAGYAQGTNGVRGTAEAEDAFASSLTAGDFDGDGRDDLVVGAPGESTTRVALTGTVHVLYGSAAGIRTSDDVAFNQYSVRAVHPAGNEAGDAFGFALAAGDLDGDTDDDLAIGAPGEDTAARDAGAVTVIEGSPDGLSANGATWLEQGSTGVPDDPELGDTFGASLAIARLDADAFADLIAGVPGEDVGDAGDAGSFTVLPGSATGPNAVAAAAWSEATTGVAGTADRGDALAYALAPGDFDGDLFTDLAVGIPGQDIGDAADAGLTHVLYGTAAGLVTEGQQRWHRGTSGVLGLVAARDLLGSA